MGKGDFKINLKAARVNANLTQEQAAKKIGVSEYALSNWEAYRRYPTMAEAKKLSEVYGIDHDYIIFLP